MNLNDQKKIVSRTIDREFKAIDSLIRSARLIYQHIEKMSPGDSKDHLTKDWNKLMDSISEMIGAVGENNREYYKLISEYSSTRYQSFHD